MRMIKRVFKIGNSSAITIDTDVLKKLKIKFGDKIVVDIIRNLKRGEDIKKEEANGK